MHDKDPDMARQMVSSLRNNNCNNHKIKQKNAFKGHNQFPSALGILLPGMGPPPFKDVPCNGFCEEQFAQWCMTKP